jgi:uncharacterized delta-60 repeat protein
MSIRRSLAVALSLLASVDFQRTATANDGSLDTSFAGSGETSVVITSGASSSGNAYGVAATGGKIIIAGTGSVPAVSGTLAIARLLGDGTPDPAFGNLSGQPGRSAFDLSAAGLTFFYYEGFAVMSGTSGTKYYLGGTSYLTPNYVGAVLRVDNSGQLDTAFAGNGYALVDLSAGGAPHSLFARAIAPAADGGVIVGGEDYTVSTPASSYLVHFLANGTQDASFNGNTGHVYVALPAGAQSIGIVDMKTDASGNIVVAIKYSPSGSGYRMAVIRVSANGILDTTFANNSTFAIVDYGVGSGSYSDTPGHVLVQAGGKIVIAGGVAASVAPFGRCGIARFNADGTPDASFGVSGRQNYVAGICTDIAIQGNRRIVAAGNVNGSNSAPYALGVNIADGSIDSNFGTAGVANYSVSNKTLTAMAIDGTQRPVLVGSTSSPGFYAARLTGDVIYADQFEGN